MFYEPPLFIAVQYKDLEIVKLLVKCKNIDVNAKDILIKIIFLFHFL